MAECWVQGLSQVCTHASRVLTCFPHVPHTFNTLNIYSLTTGINVFTEFVMLRRSLLVAVATI